MMSGAAKAAWSAGCCVPQGPFSNGSPSRQRRKSIASMRAAWWGRASAPAGHAGEHRQDIGLVAPRGIGADHGMIGAPLAKRRGQGAESGQLRHAVAIGGEMLAPQAPLFAQSLLLLDQIGGQVENGRAHV